MNIIKNASIVSGSVLVTGVGTSMLIPVAMTTFHLWYRVLGPFTRQEVLLPLYNRPLDYVHYRIL